jgi:hypothetical protein
MLASERGYAPLVIFLSSCSERIRCKISESGGSDGGLLRRLFLQSPTRICVGATDHANRNDWL